MKFAKISLIYHYPFKRKNVSAKEYHKQKQQCYEQYHFTESQYKVQRQF